MKGLELTVSRKGLRGSAKRAWQRLVGTFFKRPLFIDKIQFFIAAKRRQVLSVVRGATAATPRV